MKSLFTVIEFTIKETVKRKSFIISMLIILGIIIIGFNIPNIINAFSNDTEEKENILIIDEDDIFGEELIEINSSDEKYNYTMSKTNYSNEELDNMFENKEYDSCVRFKKKDKKIEIDYIAKSLMMEDSIPQDLMESFQVQYTAKKIEEAGITPEQLQAMFTDFEVNTIQTDESAGTGNVFVMMLLSIVLFYAIYFCAYQISTSITTEKTSKIMETLVTSTSPKIIVLGKTIGIGILGILQVVVITTVAFLSAKTFLPAGTLDSIINMQNITPTLCIVTLIYFLLGYLTYAFLYSLTGSMVSKPEDINSANSPIAILAVIGFYLSYFSMMNPASNVNKFASIFPFSSPFCMPFRILMGSANISEVMISIIILILSILIIANISIKVYSSAILNYGTKLNLKNIFKIYKANKD